MSSIKLHVFKSKLHRATVTHADRDYEGSVTIDHNLMVAADIHENEQVHVWNVTQGTRLVTYALRGEPGSGVICINGAAAHRVAPGDKVILATFAEIPADAISAWKPTVVLLGEDNTIASAEYRELAGPQRRLA